MNMLGILCQDHVYNKRLSEYLMSRSNAKYYVNSFSAMEGFLEYDGKICFDVLIVEENLYSLLDKTGDFNQIAKNYLILKDEIVEPSMIIPGHYQICRYISSEFILESVYALLGELNESGNKIRDSSFLEDVYYLKGSGKRKFTLSEEEMQCCVVGIFSEDHSCGKTSLAVLLSQFLQEKGNTLYLPMDYRNPVFASEERCIANVIYTFLCKSEIVFREVSEPELTEEYINEILNANIRKFEDISYIPASCFKEDMEGIEDMHLLKLLKLLKHQSVFRYIVIDFSDGKDFKECLDLCNMILMPSKNDCFSKLYVEKFKEEWKDYCKKQGDVDNEETQIFHKFRFLQLPTLMKASSPINYYNELPWSPLAGIAKHIADDITL